ncbi:hypothetical protein BJX70DRAFT_402785 [Aspergillus crustosus]
MAAAVAAGQAFIGWQSAREALWKHADTETVLIGHALNNDLNVLRIIHTKIVDSAILSAEGVFEPKTDFNPETVFFLNRKTQVGKKGHDSLEDTYAARDVVIWCLKNPDLFAAWADHSRIEIDAQEQERKEKREAKMKERMEKEEGERKKKEDEQTLEREKMKRERLEKEKLEKEKLEKEDLEET